MTSRTPMAILWVTQALESAMIVKILTTGGTIDKVYFDRLSEFEVGESEIGQILQEANVAIDYEIVPLLKKDSLELTDDDRRLIVETIASDPCERFVVTHGTDTMRTTAQALQAVAGKVIVLTGAMQPARFRSTDAIFNVGSAILAAQTLPPGVYIVINGRVFDPNQCRKNRERNCFEDA